MKLQRLHTVLDELKGAGAENADPNVVLKQLEVLYVLEIFQFTKLC